MSTDLVTVERSLDELAEIANREHSSVEQALLSAIHHAISAGEAIYEAHGRILESGTHEDWVAWAADKLQMGPQSAGWYERVYVYREKLPAEAYRTYRRPGGATVQPSLSRAIGYLRGLPPIRGKGRARRQIPDHVRSEARRLKSAGLGTVAIADLLGVSRHSVLVWTNPESARNQRAKSHRHTVKRREAERALRRQNDRRAAKAAGGGIEEVYTAVRKSLQIVDREAGATDSTNLRRELRLLEGEFHVIEDHLGRILRMGEPDS